MYIKKLTMTAALLALGIVLPQIMHLGGTNAGKVLLPMHLSILLGGIVLGPLCGAFLGISTPVLSAVLTGMPVMLKLPFMIIELVSYGTILGFLANRRINIILKLLVSQILGRVIYGLALMVGVKMLDMSVSPVISIITGIVTGLPGIIVQLILVPILAKAIQHILHTETRE